MRPPALRYTRPKASKLPGKEQPASPAATVPQADIERQILARVGGKQQEMVPKLGHVCNRLAIFMHEDARLLNSDAVSRPMTWAVGVLRAPWVVQCRAKFGNHCRGSKDG